MKFVHLSDLHLGKKVNEYSMIDDQKYILNQIITIIKKSKADAIVIAGDIYDKNVPTVEAVLLFDWFLRELIKLQLPVLCISGNHDSPERLAFGRNMFVDSGVYMSAMYEGTMDCVTLNDAYGSVNFYLLPFIKPAMVRRYYDEEIESYTDAVKVVLQHTDINWNERNVLVAHQFVTGATRSESEEISVGGSDNVDASAFEKFDYVALGHIHGPQNIGAKIRYCGTPLKYSLSEISHEKSVSIVDIDNNGICTVTTEKLIPLHDIRKITGTYEELTLKSNYENTNIDDYLYIVLKDENEIPNVIGKLQSVYPNIMKVEYENTKSKQKEVVFKACMKEKKTDLDLFRDLFEKQTERQLSEIQIQCVSDIFEKLKEKNMKGSAK